MKIIDEKNKSVDKGTDQDEKPATRKRMTSKK